MLPPDELIKALDDDMIPPPSPNRKADTLLKANLAFRENMQKQPQGAGFFKRLLGIGPQTLESKMKMRTLMGTSALALVGVLAVGLSFNYMEQERAGVTTGTAAFQNIQAMPDDSGAVGLMDMSASQAERSRSASALPTPMQNPVAAPGVDAATANASEPLKDFENVISNSNNSGVAKNLSPMPASPPMDNVADGAAAPQAMITSEANQPTYSYDKAGNMITEEAKPAPGMGVAISRAEPRDLESLPTYRQRAEPNTDSFANLPDSPVQMVAQAPVSTFSADVDTASYSNVRRMLRQGQLPPGDAVRTEEMVNYFNYNYALPDDRNKPFAPSVAVYPNLWHAGTQLVHIGIKAFDLPATARPPVNLVFLIDVSGSMDEPSKLPMVKSAFAMLLDQLKPQDTVSIVTYAGSSGVALKPTHASERQQILDVVQGLGAGGSTAGAEGLATAYDLAKQNYNKEGVNRIILATDGDFNVGVSEPGGLANYVAKQRSSGIFLSVLGFGMGNYQDTTMQALAQNGNGTAAYIDDMSEARRVLSDEVSKTLFTVAKDVKFQVEFNPAAVQSYRLLGYETRALRQQDFNNDKVDAGEVGAGSEVTAIYEVTPTSSVQPIDSRYAAQPAESDATLSPEARARLGNELGFLRIRYKLPNSDTSTLIERPITNGDKLESITAASADVRFSTAVAGFSRLLRHSADVVGFGYGDVVKLADGARGEDHNAERAQFVDLARTAQSLSGALPVPVEEGGVAFPPPGK